MQHRNHRTMGAARALAVTLCLLCAAALAGCSSPAQSFRDKAVAFDLSFELASDDTIDLYGRTACDGGREALGRLLSAESDDTVDTVYALATSAYCPD